MTLLEEFIKKNKDLLNDPKFQPEDLYNDSAISSELFSTAQYNNNLTLILTLLVCIAKSHPIYFDFETLYDKKSLYDDNISFARVGLVKDLLYPFAELQDAVADYQDHRDSVLVMLKKSAGTKYASYIDGNKEKLKELLVEMSV